MIAGCLRVHSEVITGLVQQMVSDDLRYDFQNLLTHTLTLLEYISRQAEQVRKGGLPPLFLELRFNEALVAGVNHPS